MTIETKYNIRDEVWFMYDSQVVSDNVVAINIGCLGKDIAISYTMKTRRKIYGSADTFVVERPQSKLFPSKQDLLNSL